MTLILAWFLAATTFDEPAETWEPVVSGSSARFRGVSVLNDRVVWASGTDGSFTRTSDGGSTWRAGQVAEARSLDFRDVEAIDDRTALLLAAGPGEASRIYRTTDAGATWSLRFTNPDPDGFLDALAFFDAEHGLAFGDPVDGRFRIFRTDDAGVSWRLVDPVGMPPARPQEGAFAASGTCLVTLRGTSRAWFATGGVGGSRVFRSEDRGRTWTAAETPILAGNASSGIFSLAFRDPDHGLAIGGDYARPNQPGPHLARTRDGGKTWTLVPEGPKAYRSAIQALRGDGFVAVGPTGSERTRDDGERWNALGATGYHAVGVAPSGTIAWAVGDDGRVARLRLRP